MKGQVIPVTTYIYFILRLFCYPYFQINGNTYYGMSLVLLAWF